jgi:hypothetical protein
MSAKIKRSLTAVVVGSAFAIAPLTLGDSPPRAFACTIQDDLSNTHTTGGIFHGWTGTWHCDHYAYQASTNHDHGTKWAELFNFATNNDLCDDLETGSTSATCTHNSTSIHIGSWNDTGAAGGCDTFADGHGICEHEMEPE